MSPAPPHGDRNIPPGTDPWDRGVAWHLRALNAIRRAFGRREKRYLTDAEWRDHMRLIIPPPRDIGVQPPKPWPRKSHNQDDIR